MIRSGTDLRLCRGRRTSPHNEGVVNQVDVIELLERDHRRISALAEKLDSIDDPREIRSLYLRIVDELTMHETIEQQVVFPAYRAMGEADDDTLEHRIGEHEELNELLAEMRGLDPAGLAFVKRGSALLLEVKGHFQREEESVFARLRSCRGSEGDLVASKPSTRPMDGID
jgi:hemerythrin superfamily protein